MTRAWKVGERCWFRFVDKFASGTIERIDGDWAEIRIGWGSEWERLECLHLSKAKAQVADAEVGVRFLVNESRCDANRAKAAAKVAQRTKSRLATAKKRLAALRAKGGAK